ncbi:mitochondrial tRNA-specific 2-thiouridylase 1-like isoform X2 [Homarus americanus]|nr:mitochondrial tRNA-specific 2-thiouridylase 1-like isoform X2 [Homarus americanus]
MRNWDEKNEKGHCAGDADAEDAEWVCRRLDIPFHEVNFVKEYWNDVFMYMIEEYKAGFTPNPDIMCNKKIKFSPFLKHAQEDLNCEIIATGHYARTSFGDNLEKYDPRKGARLLQSIDRLKDQTFFLSQISQKSLQHTMFPIGDYSKDVVRKIAESANLDRVAQKRDSTGICFIGSRNFQEFISEYIEENPGSFIDIDTREEVGTHQGIHQWTIGQRCNLSPFPQPYFVAEKHPEANNIYVVSGTHHPALFTSTMFTEPIYWIHSPASQLFTKGQLECQFRFQNTASLVPCVITTHTHNPWHHSPTQNNMVVSLATPLRAITPGQYAVFYIGDECIGSARIIRPGPSLYALNVGECRTRILKERLRQPPPSGKERIPGKRAPKQEATKD